jgi:hypothetical protein
MKKNKIVQKKNRPDEAKNKAKIILCNITGCSAGLNMVQYKKSGMVQYETDKERDHMG